MQRNLAVDDAATPHERAPDPAEPGDLVEFVTELHRVHALNLVRMANLLIRDQQTAEDVVQEAFLKLHRAMPRLTDHAQLLPYLRTAVINQARSALRARRRSWTRPVVHATNAGSAESAVIDRSERDEVMAAVRQLPRRSREVLVLRYYAGLPDSEIAATLGVSRGTVSSTASRALATLSQLLKENS